MNLNSLHFKYLPNILESHLESLVSFLRIKVLHVKRVLYVVVRCILFN